MFIVIAALVAVALITLVKSVRVVPQGQKWVIERLGQYQRTAEAGLTLTIPFIDAIREKCDVREQVADFPAQPVITKENVTVNIDSVIYYQVIDPRAATYEIENYLRAISQLTTTTLRNVVGNLTLEDSLTSRDSINSQLRAVLDEATGKWGVKVNRVELKSITPPQSIQDSMEKQLKADRDKRASILDAEGRKQAAILNAEGDKASSVTRAEGMKEAAVLAAQGEAEARLLIAEAEAKAIEQIAQKVSGKPEYLQFIAANNLPTIAQGTANKVFVVPSESAGVLGALTQVGGALGKPTV